MSEATTQPSGPDFAQGLAFAQLADGAMLLGHVGEQPVLLARRGQEVFAIDATCTHYGGPLAEGLLVEDTVRCPWHHACFSLRTGEALRPPALNPVACWRVERQGDRIVVREKAAEPLCIELHHLDAALIPRDVASEGLRGDVISAVPIRQERRGAGNRGGGLAR